MQSKPLLTIFTPTYNRVHLLTRTYVSMCQQTYKDFIWMIIDDGSTDDTKKVVEEWQKEQHGFAIKYIYKENGGMHTAHNTAYDNIITELNTCIDSDDKLPPDAVETIYKTWEKAKKNSCAGIVGLDADFDGNVIGCRYPEDHTYISIRQTAENGVVGDKKLVYRTDVVNQYPRYPVYEGEKYGSLGYLYWEIDKDYSMYAINDVLCLVEYQPDGSSKNIWKQYYKNPKGYIFVRKYRLNQKLSVKRAFIESAHYVSSCITAKEKHIIRQSPRKLMTVLAFPAGVALYYITKHISSKQV